MNKVLAAAVAAAFAVTAPAVFAETLEATTEAPIVVAAATAGDTAGTPRAASERRAHRSASDRVEARIAYIRTALKITDAQNGQFESFANVLRKHAKDRDQRMEAFRAKHMQGGPGMRHERPQMSAIDRMEFMQKRMAERQARLGEVLAAAKPLYASFSPEQKQIADEMLSRQGRGGHHRGHHGPGRGMHRG